MPKSPKGRSRGSRRKLFAGAAVAALLAIGGSSGAQAFTPNVVAEVGHFVECFGWMITDPDTHADQCLPGQPGPVGSLVETGGVDGSDVPPPPPPPPPPDDYYSDTLSVPY